MVFRLRGKHFVSFLHTAKPYAPTVLVAGDETVNATLSPCPAGAYILRMFMKNEGLYVSVLFQNQNVYINT